MRCSTKYLEMIRQLHMRTYEYLGEMRASTNPLAYCEGGFYGGQSAAGGRRYGQLLKTGDGVVWHHSAQRAAGCCTTEEVDLREDGQFALEALRYINDRVNAVQEGGRIGSMRLYGTPGGKPVRLAGGRSSVQSTGSLSRVFQTGRMFQQQLPLSCG